METTLKYTLKKLNELPHEISVWEKLLEYKGDFINHVFNMHDQIQEERGNYRMDMFGDVSCANDSSLIMELNTEANFVAFILEIEEIYSSVNPDNKMTTDALLNIIATLSLLGIDSRSESFLESYITYKREKCRNDWNMFTSISNARKDKEQPKY